MVLGDTVIGKKIIKADLESDMIKYNDLSDSELEIGKQVLGKFLQYPVRDKAILYADMLRPEAISEFNYLKTMPENYLPLVLSYEGIDLVGNEVKPGDRVRVTLIGIPDNENSTNTSSYGAYGGYDTSETPVEEKNTFVLGDEGVETKKIEESPVLEGDISNETQIFNLSSEAVTSKANEVEVVELFNSVMVDDLLNSEEESVRQIFKETLLLPESSRQILYKTPEFKSKIKGNYIVLLLTEEQYDQYLRVTTGASGYQLKLALRSRKNSETIVDIFNTLPAELQAIVEENSTVYNKSGSGN